ncbi:MAG: ABC transporter ATP-binding protein [Candidatus Latescibacteria bacterium]|nr:ABC transporter ATP-binding protein [Candidatus Latescibacterota bacterium]
MTTADTTQSLVSARQLDMRFNQVEVLTGIDLDIAKGQFVSIVGPSGCGKSTLLRLIAGLAAPAAGTLHIAGLSPLEARRTRQDLAFVFQDATLLPWRTVEQNVALPLELSQRQHRADALSVDQALELVGLSPFARSYPRQLSGGMRMRVSIARALVTHPGLLLMDEPFGALDELTRQRLNEELLRLWSQIGFTCVFITHNVAEAVFLSQRVLVMSARPGRWLAEVAVPLPHPRGPELRTSAAFNHIAEEVSQHLHRTHL